MSLAHPGGKHRRRHRIVLPAAGATLLLAAAGAFLMAPADAAGTHDAALAPHPAPGPAQLTTRVAAALRGSVHAAPATVRATTATPAATATPTGASTPGADTGRPVTPDIIGGTGAAISTAPWMVQLWYSEDDGTGFFCGGTLVSPTKILTAGHCVTGTDWADNGAVVSGTAQTPTTDSHGDLDLHGGTLTGVARQWLEPSFHAPDGAADNDVAVLTLDRPLSAKTLAPAAAGDTADYAPGTHAKLYGWGRTTSAKGSTITTALRTATLPLDTPGTCTASFGSDFVPAHMLCAGTPATGSDAGTVSACNGDSGGPLVVGGHIVGVVSWGVQDCVAKGAYSVFGKVSTYAALLDAKIADTDFTGDGRADLIAVTPQGAGYLYRSTGTGLAARAKLTGTWTGRTAVHQADLNRDGYQDFLTLTTGGQLVWRHYSPTYGKIYDDTLSTAFGAVRAFAVPGDLTGDHNADLVALDTSGTLWLYPGDGHGHLGARTRLRTGWGGYGSSLYGTGDLTGDGLPDLVVRDTHDAVWLYPGTGTTASPFGARVKIATWTYSAYDLPGDLTGDGHADLVARDHGGALWLYKGTGSAAHPFAARVRIGTGYTAYSHFG